MRFGIFFSYWEDDWKGDYFKYVKKARELGYDALEVSAGELFTKLYEKSLEGDTDCSGVLTFNYLAGELLVMSKDKLRELRAVSKDLDIQISANLGPPESTTFPPAIPRSARPVSRSTPI